MKVTVSKNDLRDAIARLMPAVAVKPSTPVLAGIYLQTEGNSALVLRATNFDIDVTAKIPANVEVAGKTVTTGKTISAIVNKLGGDIVTLIDADKQLTIRSEAASFDLLVMDADDFPAETKLKDDSSSFRIARDALKNLIRRTAFAVAKDNSRPIFTGVNFKITGTDIEAVSTNASRIAIHKDKIYDEAEAQFAISANTLRSIQTALSTNSIVTIDVDKTRAAFEFDNIRFITRLLEGIFPPYDKIIPASFATTAEVDRAELLAAVDRIQIVASGTEYKTIMCKFTDEGLELYSNDYSVGKAIEHVDAKVTGNEIELGMNYQYVIDVLKVLESKTITIGMNESLTPTMFTGEDDAGFAYIATPLRTH